MAYNGFCYYSSQDDAEIEYLIDRFEIRQCSNEKRRNKQKMKMPSFPRTKQTRTRHTQHPFVKIYGFNQGMSSDVKEKILPYTRCLRKNKTKHEIISIECDKHLGMRQISVPNNFNAFRQHFYNRNHEQIKSSLNSRSDIELINIRQAPIDKSVQNEFMKQYQQNPKFYPHLVYHGTKLTNIQSILDYGFLIPNQIHPTNPKAPKITVSNGTVYGTGIYCSQTADYSLSYCNTVNTLLVCAALPKRDGTGSMERSHGNILVLSHVSEIIPLFLMDFRFVNSMMTNQTWFRKKYLFKANLKPDPNKPLIVSRKYLRKVLNYMKDLLDNRRRRRGRRNNRRKIQIEDEYQRRLFDPFVT